MAVEWKRLAYSDDFEAQLSYPLAHDDDHVKATTYFPDAENRYAPWKATDPSKQLTGGYTDRSWVSASLGHINQRFHIDLATARYLHGLYYENFHNTGTETNIGIKTITIWGSNESSAFDDIDYAHDTNWTQIGGTHICAEHVALDQVDPQFITEFNSTVAYRYYALKIANNWGHGTLMAVRRLVFITSFNVCELQHVQNSDTALGAVGEKNPPIDADKAIYRDSTASDALVTSTWTQIKAFLKSYFDTVYAVVLGDDDNYVTDAEKAALHPAVTIDGTSPLSLSGQAISLKNDAAAAITEVDTGTLANSDTVVPTSKAVYDAIGAKHVHNLTVTVKASGGDFTSIQSAIDFFVGKTVTGTNTIAIDPGTYDEHLVIAAINLNGNLILTGDTRGLAGVSWVNGVVNYHTMANGGSGTFTITRGGAGNTVLTVSGSTTNPDFDADGWVSGDKVLVYTGTTPNTIVEMTLASVSNNTLTATGAWPDPAPATSGAGYTIALQPSVKIIPSAPSTYALLIRRIGKVTIQGIYIYHNTASIIAWFMETALVFYSGVLTRGGDFAVAVLAGSDINGTGSARLTMMDSNAGIEIQTGSTSNMPWAVLVKVNSNFGFFAGYMSLLRIHYAIAVKCPIGVFAYAMSCIYATSSQAIGCATSYSPTVGVDGNGNSFIIA